MLYPTLSPLPLGLILLLGVVLAVVSPSVTITAVTATTGGRERTAAAAAPKTDGVGIEMVEAATRGDKEATETNVGPEEPATITFSIGTNKYNNGSHIEQKGKRHSRRGTFKYNGFTFTAERYCANVTMNTPVAQQSLQHLATTGTDSIAVVVTQYQMTISSTQIFPQHTPRRCTATPSGYCSTTTDDDLRATIRYIQHELGLRVMLKPHIDLIADGLPHWRGSIGNNSGRGPNKWWDDWFDSYTKFITHYAKIAEDEHVMMFSASTELVTPSKEEHYWRQQVIPAIRRAYHGILTDAAIFSSPFGTYPGEMVEKKWWDLIDVIGIDEYLMSYVQPTFAAAHRKKNWYMTDSELEFVWVAIAEEIAVLRYVEYEKKPVIFTEIGFCAGLFNDCYDNGDKSRPRDATTAQSLEYQARQFDMAMKVMSRYEWFHGLFWWNWVTDAAFGGHDNTCMDVKYKPAEHVLRKWYGATEPIPARPSYEPVCECWL